MIPWWISLVTGFIGFFLGILAICVLAIGGRTEDDDEILRLNLENRELKNRLGPRALY